MKKTLGLLALTVAVSSVSLAEQDFVKSLSLDVQGANQFDAHATSAVKTGERKKLKFIKTVAGTVILSDEAGLEADFSLGHVDTFNRSTTTPTGRANLEVEPKLALRKDVKLGNLDTTLKVGYEGKIERATVAVGNPTNVYTNTFYFQPSFKVVGVSVEPKVLYAMYDTNSSDILGATDTSEKHKVWGVDLNLSYGNTLAEGKYGKLEYSVSLNNKYRRLASTLTGANAAINNDSTKNSKYEVSFNPSVTYTTPDFVGFTGSVKVSDELSKVIGSNTYSNGVKVELNANYKKEVETAVGKVVVKPYVSYNLINRDTVNNSNGGKELKTGLKVSLEK